MAHGLAPSEEALDTPLSPQDLCNEPGLLPGVPVATGTGPTPAGLIQLPGRTMLPTY